MLVNIIASENLKGVNPVKSSTTALAQVTWVSTHFMKFETRHGTQKHQPQCFYSSDIRNRINNLQIWSECTELL